MFLDDNKALFHKCCLTCSELLIATPNTYCIKVIAVCYFHPVVSQSVRSLIMASWKRKVSLNPKP